ncbi:hypothetical protein, partial [Methylobacterium oxalidis]|uniref:hypothetical protein n=1 Tax=Methylobacterium oxalidis TaxID=944322 RepID=UPI0033156E8A
AGPQIEVKAWACSFTRQRRARKTVSSGAGPALAGTAGAAMSTSTKPKRALELFWATATWFSEPSGSFL